MVEPLLVVCVVLLLLVLAAVLYLVAKTARAGNDQARQQLAMVERMGTLQASLADQLDKNRDRTEHALREEVARAAGQTLEKLDHARDAAATQARTQREEIDKLLHNFTGSLTRSVGEIATQQKNQLDSFSNRLSHLTQSNEQKLEQLRQAVEQKLAVLQEDNARKLEQMRQTVDEKLQGTLEKRLGESFKLVSERLEQVHKGLGEMQNLASGVGDLKKVLTNVKTRGTWGEVLLGNLLEQVLTPEQYERDVATRPGSGEVVEFALKLPGRDEQQECVWLPIDSKFPKEDYERLVDAQEKADPEASELAARALEQSVRKCAKDICAKYIAPPHTTDFAIMFLPTEGLFAEVIRRVGLVDYVQRECRVAIAGPTTLASLLNSLQMGFRTLAIQKRSSEVWVLLGAIKAEFGKFGDVLDAVQKKLKEASSKIETAGVRTRAIERKLRGVEALSTDQSQNMLGPLDTPETPELDEAATE